MKKQIISLISLATLLMVSCSAEQGQDTQAAVTESVSNHSEHTNPQMTAHTAMQPASTGDVALTADGLPKELVCMVNNAYMGRQQYPVEHEGKMYYGCCEMCVNTIQQQHQVRVALDPATGKEVDKSMAYITLKPGSKFGEVLYFESEDTYKAFMAKHQ